jgi:hypothetical protein
MAWVLKGNGYVWEGPGNPDYSTHPIPQVRGYALQYQAAGITPGVQTSSDWRIAGNKAINDKTGQSYTIDYSTVEGSKRGTKTNLENAILYYLNSGGKIPDKDTFGDDISRGKTAWRNLSEGLDQFIKKNNITVTDGTFSEATGNPEEAALAEYYKSLYDVKGPYAEGRSGQALYDNLAGIYENQASTQGAVANATYQQQALQQAQVVKQITDQVRAERMARLKSGMSESQIANQDMQMLMANVNTLNQNATMMNQGRLESQANMNTAKDQAYMDYLNQSNTRGQVATGMHAADVGSAYRLAIQLRAMNPNLTMDEALAQAQAREINPNG